MPVRIRHGRLPALVLLVFMVLCTAGQAQSVPRSAAESLVARTEVWARSPVEQISTRDLQAALDEVARLIAGSDLEFDRFTRYYELGKEIIRTGRFIDPNNPGPSSWSSLPHNFRVQIAEDEAVRTQYRLGLMKRLTVAYVGAVASRFLEPPACRPAPAPGAVLKIDGREIPALFCPDPHVERLRDYVEAIRQIQSADAELLAAEIENLAAEQQLATDIMAAIPLVGEAIDIYALYAGESLAGTKLHFVERAITVFFLALPVVGPAAAKKVAEAAQRSPRVVVALDKLREFLDGALAYGAWRTEAFRGQAAAMREAMAARWGTSVAQLAELREFLALQVERLARPGQAGRPFRPNATAGRATARPPGSEAAGNWFIHQKLRDAAQDRVHVMDLPDEWKARALSDATDVMRRGLMAAQPTSRRAAIAASGMLRAHGEAFSHVARKRGEILLVREVNPAAAALIARNAATKPMSVKAKSATRGIIAGTIPVDQTLNKTATALAEAKAKLARATPGTPAHADLETLVAGLGDELAEGWETVRKCLQPPACAKAVPFPRQDGKLVHKVTDPASGETLFVVEAAPGRWADAETDAVLAFTPATPPEAVMVLGHPETGKIFTADYDLLAFGRKGKQEVPGYNSETGFITASQQQTVDDLNRAVRGEDPGFHPRDHGGLPYEGGNVTHHGAEENFFKSPGIEGSPVTAYLPNGGVVSIPNCDRACMQAWCRIKGPGGILRCDPRKICRAGEKSGCIPVDGDRLAKDFFHTMRLAGYAMDPNPRWGWGAYNGLGGWLGGLHCNLCDAALWPRPGSP